MEDLSSNSNLKVIPVILSGGTGTRLWPISRESFPKQYQPITQNNNKSLLQKTQERISSQKNILPPIIVCNEEHRFIVAEQMRQIDIKPLSILLEPFPRNTAPAITIASLKAQEFADDPILLFLPADHTIKDEERFIQIIQKGVEYAEKGRLVTFGISPSRPEIGFGYIESKEILDQNLITGYEVKRFIEKPNIEKANQLYKDKKYSWNSGIFLFKSSNILNQIEKFHPAILNHAKVAIKDKLLDLDFQRLGKKSFGNCENISIDQAVMEKTNLATVIPFNVGWSDIGSWEALWESESKDNNLNVISGKVISKNSKNCYFRGENKLLVCLDVENLVVVETNDAILVSKKKSSQKVKDIFLELNKSDYPELKYHKKIYRPWGYFLSIQKDLKWQIKKLFVKPGASLSLQMHNHRSEHWVVVKGKAHVEIENKKSFLEKDQSIYIPLGTKHRLSNFEATPLIIIEVQSGSMLSEDDIVRFEDNYGRSNTI